MAQEVKRYVGRMRRKQRSARRHVPLMDMRNCRCSGWGPNNGQRVFLVAALSVWTQLLEDQVERLTNFEVVGSAPDGAAMLVEFERIQPPADIVVIDVSTRLALQTASALPRSHPTTRLVAIGLDEDPDQAIAWAAAGAVGLLGRTASRDELLSALTDVARGEAYCSAGISGALLRGVGGSSGGVRPCGSAAPLTRREERWPALSPAASPTKRLQHVCRFRPAR